MAISKSVRVLFVILAGATALVSCAKKDSEFKGRKNAAGATLVGDPAANDRAQAAAAASGNVFDVLGVSTPQFTGQSYRVTSRIIVNAGQFDITTTNVAVNQPASQTGPLGDVTVEATGVCGDSQCSSYYLFLKFARGNQQLEQIAMKHFSAYTNETSTSDYAIERGPNEFLTLDQARQILDNPVVDGAPTSN